MAGRQQDLMTAIKNLVEYDYDAIETYDTAVNKLENKTYKNTLRGFKDDHEQHIDELSTFLQEHGEDVPDSGSMKRFTRGKVIPETMVGDHTILEAVRNHESDNHTAYECINQHKDVNEELKDTLVQGLADEEIHSHWLNGIIRTRDSEL